MKVLFVRSGNNGLDPISQNQGNSLETIGCEIAYFDIIGKGIRGYLSNISKLRDQIKKINPDVVHAHYSLSGIIATLCFSHKPIICSLMGSDIHNASKIHIQVIRFFSKHLWAGAIVKSESMKQKIKIRNIEVIPNGVDLTKLYPFDSTVAKQKLGWDIHKFHILFPSNPKRREKNYPLAEQAITLLKDEVGDVIDIHTLTGIPHSEIINYFNAADVTLLTSFYEGSPNVIKEAMACNCPIITTEVGDVREIIGKTKRCFIHGPEQKTIKEALLSIYFNNERSNGRENIEKLDSKIIAQKIIDLYNSKIKKSKAKL